MNRLDRLFGILLHLRPGKVISAAALARAFEVSPRTIYRDVETLSALGVPVYAERGREGGLRLLEGYFLPPIMFSREEAVAIVLALTLMRSLPSRPFSAALDTAETRLVAAMPDRLRQLLAGAQHLVGFEQTPADVFHREPSPPPEGSAPEEAGQATAFMAALLEKRSVRLRYRSPYAPAESLYHALPLGMFWDRGHWYLVGAEMERQPRQRLWRADRVLELRPGAPFAGDPLPFDVRRLMGRHWLKEAMDEWMRLTPVRLRLAPQQSARLQQDWYYRHVRYEPEGATVLVTLGEEDPQVVLELVRWLGPGAELLEPEAWRDLLRRELEEMLARHGGPGR